VYPGERTQGGLLQPDLWEWLRQGLKDRYRLERELGQGGTAVVFLATDLRHDRMVAIKVLRPELAASVGAERFLREIRLTAGLTHPHILPLLDSGEVLQHPDEAVTDAAGRSDHAPVIYYVMPYVPGESLRDRLDREGQLPVAEATRLAGEVADGLGYLHEQGIVHRDIKPENILLSGGHAVVGDLGIGRVLQALPAERLTQTGLALGTAAYMSPEQALGEARVDHRSDIYALGCLLYEMLAGEPPYTGPTSQAIIARQLTEPVPPLSALRDLPPGLESVVRRALARAPADRFESASQFLRTLRAPAAPAAPDGAAPPARPRRNWWLGWTAALVLPLIVLTTILLQRRAKQPPVAVAAATIAVLPFTPASADTALQRLGRDLSTTVSATLDGVGNLSTVDRLTILAHWPTDQPPGSLEENAARSRRLGAGSVLHGSIVGAGNLVRLDVSLESSGSLKRLAHITVTGPPDDINALTDSITWQLLRQIWRGGAAPTPSLDGALRTRSVVALRAFLAGERGVSGGQWDAAVSAYREAFQADSGFYLAAARLMLAQEWSLQERDTMVEAVVRNHLADVPPRDRLLMRAFLQQRESMSATLQTAAEQVRANPDYWFGWLFYADWLFHFGPTLGHRLAEASVPFERALDLAPDLLPAWDHLGLLTARQRDLEGLRRVLVNLDRLDARATLAADGFGDHVLLLRLAERELAGDDDALAQLVADAAREDLLQRRFTSSFFDPMELKNFSTQVRLYRTAASMEGSRAQPVAPPSGTQWLEDWRTYWLSRAWLGRGAWDSALVALDQSTADGRLEAFRTAVLGAAVGAIEPAAAASMAVEPGALTEAVGKAEHLWLAGILGWLRRDRPALLAAARELARLDAPGAPALRRSLDAHLLQLDGRTATAAMQLARLEWELADRAYAETPYPLLPQIDRLHGASWSLTAGDTLSAERLLEWRDAVFHAHQSVAYTIPLTPIFELAQARIDDRRGRTAAAATLYREFVRVYDLPVPAHRRLVEEARAALRRLER